VSHRSGLNLVEGGWGMRLFTDLYLMMRSGMRELYLYSSIRLDNLVLQ
jgi:hypothetical protein